MPYTEGNRGGAFRSGRSRVPVLAGATLAVFLILVLAVLFWPQGDSGLDEVAAAGDAPAAPALAEEAPPEVAPVIAEVPQPEEGTTAVATLAGGEEEAPPSQVTSAREDRVVRIFSGRVTSKETGAPIAGARVGVYDVFSMFFNVANQSAAPPPVKTGITDEEGRFRIELKRSEYEFGGTMPEIVRASSEGFAALVFAGQPSRHAAASDEVERNVDFALPYGEAISGRVVTTEGEGIPVAFVGGLMLREPDWQRVYAGEGDRIPSAWGTADRNGYYRIEGIAEAERVAVPARADGFIPGMSERVNGGASEVEIVLERGVSTLHGHIYDAEDKPLPGAQVLVLHHGSSGDLPPNTFFSAHADDAGYYRLEALPSGDMMVAVTESSQSLVGLLRTGEEPLHEEVHLPHGEEKTKDFHFRPKTLLRGRFVDTETERPVPGVRVSTLPFPGTETYFPVDEDAPREEVVSDYDGRFAIPVSAQRSMPVFYLAPKGYMPDDAGGPVIQPTRDEAGEYQEAVVRLRRGSILRGRVVDRNDAPVAGATVGFDTVQTNPNQWQRGSRPNVRSDDEGRFEITTAAGQEIVLLAFTSGGLAEKNIAVPEGESGEEVVLRLQPAGSLSGTVRNASGEPVAGATVRFQMVGPASRSTYARVLRVSHREAKTEGDGTYTISSVYPGELGGGVVAFEDEEYAATAEVTIALAPGEHKSGVDFTVEVGDVIEGVVLNEDGEPIEGASISFHIASARTHRPPIQTDAEGYFRIGGLEVDAVVGHISVYHVDYQGEHLNNVSALDGPQTIVLKRTRTVELMVRDGASGAPSPRYDYTLKMEQYMGPGQTGWMTDYSRRRTEVRDPEGRTEIARLHTMTYRIEAIEFDPEDDSPTGRRGAVEFDMSASEAPERVVVELAPGRTIRGRVVMADTGQPVAGAKVSIHQHHLPWMSQMETAEEQVETNSSGQFEISDVFPGTHRLRVVKDDLQPRERTEVVVSADRDPPAVEIALVGGGAIFGTVHGQDGEPLEGIVITAMPEEMMWGMEPSAAFTAETDEDGAYRIEGLKAGNIHLTAQFRERGTQQSRHVDLSAGEEREVNFEVEGQIEVTGRVVLNGAAPQMSAYFFQPERALTSEDILQDIYDVQRTTQLIFQPAGGSEYSAFVEPGSYSVRMRSFLFMGGGNGFVVGQVDVAPEPARQEFDFEVQTQSAEVVVTSLDPEGLRPFPRGTMRLSQRSPSGREYEDVVQMQQNRETMRLQQIPEGEYRVAFRSGSGDDEVSGDSEWTPIGEGLENVIVVFVGVDTAVEVGRWTPSQITEEATELTWDLTPHLTEGGSKEFEFNYTGGMHALVVERVEIVANGNVVSSDSHVGWAGAVARDTVYRLEVPAGGSVQLGARVRGHGGGDSNGVVKMRRR